MDEIELKILEIDRKPIEHTLISLGAVKVFDDEIYTIFYDDSHHTIKTNKNLLRLRTMGKKPFLTFKKYVSDQKAKIRKEYEVEVSDFQTMNAILESLGFHQDKNIRKHRTSYKLENTSFEFDRHLDEYHFIPEFMEIESDSPLTIDHYLNLFNIDKENVKPWSFFELADFYTKKQKKQ